MKRFVLVIAALLVPAGVWAQGVRDPSTPNQNVIISGPSQPAPPNATRNIPSTIQAPVTRGGRATPYYGNRTRTSGSNRR